MKTRSGHPVIEATPNWPDIDRAARALLTAFGCEPDDVEEVSLTGRSITIRSVQVDGTTMTRTTTEYQWQGLGGPTR